MLSKRLSAIEGRTFVCGDIHGSYSCVEKFLDRIYFDEAKDRLICAGDLIDRGPENENCLDLILQPWFHTVKGNHEEMMEDYFTDGEKGKWWLQCGGQWGMYHLTDATNEAFGVRGIVKDHFPNMPYLITAEQRDGSIFHVLHAELWSPTPITDADLANPERLLELASVQTIDGNSIVWGRRLFLRMNEKVLDEREIGKIHKWAAMENIAAMYNPKLSHIYSGHTPVRQPTQFFGQTNLDTKAWKSYDYSSNRYGPTTPPDWCALTFTEPETGRFWKVNDNEFIEVSPCVII